MLFGYKQLSSLYENKTFTQIFQKMLKQDLILQTTKQNRSLHKGKNKKVSGLIKDGLGGKIMLDLH